MTKEDKSFDLKIKSMLEQAEAPVPEGAWEAIRARIPARAAAPVRRVWWGVGAGLAAAAAVALALMLGGTFRSAPVIGQESLAQAVETPAAPEVEVKEIPVAPEAIQTASTRSSVRKAPVAEAASTAVQSVGETAPVTAQSAPVGVKEQETAAAPASESTQASKADPKPASKPASSAPAAQPKETWSDPFARMAYEDAHRKSTPKASFQIHGLVGTNDKAMTALRSGMMAAPARVKSETGQSASIIETGESKYAIPISVGLGAKFYLSERWALGTGINFSLLNRTFPGAVASASPAATAGSASIRHTVHYIGIPVNLYFDLVSSKFVKMYAFGGGSIEKGIGQKYVVPGGEKLDVWKMSVPGVQGSADLGLGVQMKISDHLGLYLDPSAKYYFGANQPKTIRTQQPVMFNLEFGVRFDL